MSFKPTAPQSLSIAGPCGELQSIVDDPAHADAPAVAVICHPHPLQQGTMHNKVVHTLARACNECGAPSVRFNYRGVGASAGAYDNGVGETEDALAVIAWARQRWPQRPLWLAGFSFGGGVALRAALRTDAARLITVAPALAGTAPAAGITRPWLLIQGDADEVIPASQVLDWAQAQTPAPQISILTGAGHFFHGRLVELRALARQWLSGGGLKTSQ